MENFKLDVDYIYGKNWIQILTALVLCVVWIKILKDRVSEYVQETTMLIVNTKNYTKNILNFKNLFWSMTNKCTIFSQIITSLHVSTLSCHPQEACNQYVSKLPWGCHDSVETCRSVIICEIIVRFLVIVQNKFKKGRCVFTAR